METLWSSSGSLCSSPFWYSVLGTLTALVSLDSQLCLFNSGGPQGSLSFPLLHCGLVTVSKQSAGAVIGPTSFVFHLLGIVVLHWLICRVWKLSFYVFCLSVWLFQVGRYIWSLLLHHAQKQKSRHLCQLLFSSIASVVIFRCYHWTSCCRKNLVIHVCLLL